MSNRKNQFENTLLTVGIGALLAGATYGVYSYLTSRHQEEQYSEYPSEAKKSKKFDGETCPICIERLTSNCTTFTCHHTFHKKCIDQWKAINKTCPVCRMEL